MHIFMNIKYNYISYLILCLYIYLYKSQIT